MISKHKSTRLNGFMYFFASLTFVFCLHTVQ